MQVTRRDVLGGAAAVAGSALGTLPAWPQGASDFPAKDFRAICNYPAGTGPDIFVRFFAERLRMATGRTVLTDNRSGTFGNLGTVAASKAKADGYTLLITPGSLMMAAAVNLYKKPGFDPDRDFAPVTTLAWLAYVVLVDAKSPVKSIADLTAALKAKSGKASFGASSSAGLVAAALYNSAAGTNATKVQYKDNVAMLNGVLDGSVDFVASDAPWAIEQIAAGKLRGLAVTSAQRTSVLSDLPTMEQADVTGFRPFQQWWGVFVPDGTPQPVIDRLEALFNKIVASPETKTFLGNFGADPLPGNARMLGDLLAKDTQQWADYVKLAGIDPQ